MFTMRWIMMQQMCQHKSYLDHTVCVHPNNRNYATCAYHVCPMVASSEAALAKQPPVTLKWQVKAKMLTYGGIERYSFNYYSKTQKSMEEAIDAACESNSRIYSRADVISIEISEVN